MMLPTRASMCGITVASVVIGIAGQRMHIGDELAGLGAADRGGGGDVNAELVRPVGLALADTFDFRRVKGIDLRPALMLFLLAHAPRQRQQLSSCAERRPRRWAICCYGPI